jgi:phosphate/sulfate permease
LYKIAVAIWHDEKWSIIAGIIGGITTAFFVSPLLGAILAFVIYLLVRIIVDLKQS